MAIALNQLGALGQADVIAAILGPVATGGADIYRTYSDSKQNKDELKQREREFQSLSKLYDRQQVAQKQQAAIAAATSLRQSQIRATASSGYAPYVFGAFAIGGLALVAIAMARGGRRG